MRSTMTWFVVLAIVCVAGPYLFGIRPRRKRHWVYIAVAIAFLAWILPLMVALR